MSRQADVWVDDRKAGLLAETDEGYTFQYDPVYLDNVDSLPVSLTMPLREQLYQSAVLFPFFDGLIPEGWLLQIAEDNWKLAAKDRFGLLLACCRDCIGNVSIMERIS
ncbi:HipA N-terminal domain-containing protein [Fibrella sp. HMF5335]|uniref:HipA N-terminal domain-containing protein n=1 Tax=Fibrella rubiginis TaxID=2817060 RepID=A0A939GLS1_9BACT|nr:HipA N-terminal domain-containing protein [Fibrella rubiginis]MBO0939150.1 HipA N-terminal domain-containing protein [Fibrella rubiginis]